MSLTAPERETVVDARVAEHGGTRKGSRSNYDFPGMVRDGHWRQTDAHKFTRFYGCALCGQKFSGPHAAYTHLAKLHNR